jgi:hypothetical protein
MKIILLILQSRVLILVLLVTLLSHSPNVISAQKPSIQWQKTLGGTAEDLGSHSIINAADGSIVTGGVVSSNDGDGLGNHGGKDLLVTKISTTGNVHWKKLLGGSNDERGTFLLQARDGGIIVGGTTSSRNGDVSSNYGGYDIWILKLETSSGNIRWQKTIGVGGNDELVSIRENSNGEILVGGSSYTKSSRTYAESADFLTAKLSATGTLLWQRTFGGSGVDRMNQLQSTRDGGCVAVGMTDSRDGQITGFHGGYRDTWLIKVDAKGNLQWQRALGGSGDEYYCAVQTAVSNGLENYVVAVRTDSKDGDVSGNHGWVDIWVARLNNSGKEFMWRRTFGSTGWDELGSIKPTQDSGFILGTTTTTSNNNQDASLIKIKAGGEVEWQKTLGGSGSDEIMYFQQTIDKVGVADGYIVNVFAQSADGDIPDFHGVLDVGLVKLDLQGHIQWAKCFGGSKEEWPLNRQSYPYNPYFTTFAAAHDEYQLQAPDGNFMFLTSTISNDGDVQGLNYNPSIGFRYDNWVVKVAPPVAAPNTAITAIENDLLLQNRFGIKAYPNPFSLRTTVRFVAPNSGKTTIDLFNADGKKVRTIFNSSVTEGQFYTVPIQDATLPKGVYFYIINNNKSRQTGRLIKN